MNLRQLLFGEEEKRAGSFHPSADPPIWFGQEQFLTSSGISVTPENAATFAPVFNALTLISSAVGMAPLKTFRRISGDTVEPLFDHPLWKLLMRRPNKLQTPFEFKEMMTGHMLLRGDCYAQIIYDQRFNPIELIPLHPDRVKVKLPEGVGFGPVTYEYEDPRAGKAMLSPLEVWHIKGPFSNGFHGESTIMVGRNAIGVGMSTEDYGAKFYANGSTPLGILEYPQKLEHEDAKRLRDDWERFQAGSQNRHRVAVLEDGMQWKNMGMTNQDAQYIETQRWNTVRIAQIFNLPPHKLKDMSKSSFNNIESEQISYLQDSLLPWLTRWEESTVFPLLSQSKDEDVFTEFDTKSFVRGDFKTRSEGNQSAIMAGWKTRNEVRAEEKLNPIDGLDEPLVPLNMVTAAQAEIMDAEIDAENSGDDRNAIVKRNFRPLFEEVIGRALRKEAKAIECASTKEKPAKYLQDFHRGFLGYLIEVTHVVAQGFCDTSEISVPASIICQDFFDDYLVSRYDDKIEFILSGDPERFKEDADKLILKQGELAEALMDKLLEDE